MQNQALPTPAPLSASGATARRVVKLLDNSLYVVTIGLFAVFAVTVPYFFTVENLINLLTSASLTGILAAGFSIALIAGLIDTSMPGVVAVSSVLMGVLLQRAGLPLPVTLLIVMASAVLMGLLNSLMVVKARINAFIATLATGALFFGVCLSLTAGQTITITSPEVNALLVRPLGIPLSVWLMFLCYAVFYVMLNHTRLGAHLYAVGANYNAARLSGVPTDRTVRVGLVIFALTGALTSVLATARAGQTLLFGTTLSGFEFTDTLTAVLLGGVSLFGGAGKIERNLVAVLFLAILANGLILLGTPTGVWFLIRGVALVAAVIMDVVRQRLQ
jgi:ribose transport system permease protein